MPDTHTGDPLTRAMARARLTDTDVATRLGVDPKTVERWRYGRVPQKRHRWALADLVKVSEFELWPQLSGAAEVSHELWATYDYRAMVPRDVWVRLFERARHDIGVLVYSGLFIAEDAHLVRLLARKADEGVSVRLLLGDPDSPLVAQRGIDEGIDDALTAKIRNALVHYRELIGRDGVELRLHSTVLYNSIYRADDEVLVNPHVYGVSAAQAPVLHFRRHGESELFATYLASFDRVWQSATPLEVAA